MLGDKIVYELVAADSVCVLPGYRNWEPLQDPRLVQAPSCLRYLLPYSLSSSFICLFLKAFHADGRSSIAQSCQSLNCTIIEQRSIGVDLEEHIVMFFE